ncbi:ZIP family metal transporter [Clostridium oryzae]|uniref:Zinc transporter ZupT n=1 Tax=Clostridium oryzae TaxID=1450648 RepID=A0A1V4IUG1_9CLOT|nr:ZIP family metal transporter [Clostridium oryzae]OPJ63414.1 zinc transporter ZupT [Clostridium oryzae]
MNHFIIKTFILSGISLLGTMLGAALGVVIRNPSKKMMSSILGFAAGLMMAVVAFELIPESQDKLGTYFTALFILAGMAIIIFLDSFVLSEDRYDVHSKVALLTAIGLMLHNFPEGIVMGCGMAASGKLGIEMSIVIGLHDIPEGMAVAAPLMMSRYKSKKILSYAFVTALPTTLGAFIGNLLGTVSQSMLGISLALASGIMLYVSCGQLIPESWRVGEVTAPCMGICIGVLIGIIMISLL